MRDDEREIELTREYFRVHGLLPEIPRQFDADRAAEDHVLAVVLERPRVPATAPWRRVALVAATVVALVVITGIGGVFRGAPAAAAGAPAMLSYGDLRDVDASNIESAPSAHDVLLSAAALVAVSADSQGAGGVQYVSSYGWLSDVRVGTQSDSRLIYPTFTQWWLDADGAVRLDERREPALTADGQLIASVSEANAMSDTSETNPPGTVPPDMAKELPADVEPLRAALVGPQAGLPCGENSWRRAECLVSAIQTIYQQYVVSPQLASAMWRALATEPEIRYLGSTTDRLGRAATAVALPPEPGQPVEQTTVLLVSPDTGEYLGNETITLHDLGVGITRPTVTGFVELLTSRRVASFGAIS